MLMMMNDYGSQYAPSTMSSETLSNSCGSSSGGGTSRTNRIRTIRLVRPSGGNGILTPPTLTCRHGPNLGFSLRGGREHGTGFFVSYVEPASEAHRQGLRVGDQIIRINGFTVDDAVHKEVLQLVSNHTHLTLKVRSVGMIPVKDKKTDALSWQIITDSSSLRSSPQLNEKIQDVRINIMVPPRSKLGCGICKGPDWKPGIFIQFTKENGIAREAGLRPGDQILYCNNVDFSDIPFNEAVNLMKTSRQLDLIVRKSAGSELFPSESSGYNSSASSVTGDQSPSWSDSKRLSIVKEESHDLEERLDKLRTTKWEWNKNKDNNADVVVERKPIFKSTIINLSENGTTIKINGNEEECQNYDGTNRNIQQQSPTPPPQQQFETKTVVVEVHRSQETKLPLTKSSSISSFGSLASTTSSSLSSAICQEIQRRSEKMKNENSKPTIDEQLQMKKILKGVTSEKQHQHNKLMDEFKKAHKKMFKSLEGAEEAIQLQSAGGENTDRIANKDLSKKLSERLSNLTVENGETTNLPSTTTTPQPPPPPPPPPLPVDNNNNNNTNDNDETDRPKISQSPIKTTTNKKPKAPPVPVKTSTLSSYQQQQQLPPPCPTPDYDTLSITSTSSLQRTNNNIDSKTSQDCVEMDSLESYKLNNSNIYEKPIKPPDTYFNNNIKKNQLTGQLSNSSKSSCSSNQSIKQQQQQKQRPISVTIGEYPSGTVRRQPARFDFLQNNNSTHSNGCGSVTREFASELAQTLNRSNLRKRTESLEDLLSCHHIKAQNGSIRISLNNSLMNRNLAKSTDDLLSCYSNTVTININNNNNNEKKNETINGILKNGNHKTLVQQKSITFGEMPTVINDNPLRVS